ncbi:MAG: hypothetical protein ACE5FE_07575 [Acidiferrobacterales bacterium]
MKTETRQYLLTEYPHLRAEILDALKEVPANEKWALVTSGAFWAWLASLTDQAKLIPTITWVPAALTFLLFLRWRALEQKFGTLGAYLLRIEQALELENFGWETHIGSCGKHWFRYYGWAFWGLLFAGNVFLAIFVTG